jgi:hypothetical protein
MVYHNPVSCIVTLYYLLEYKETGRIVETDCRSKGSRDWMVKKSKQLTLSNVTSQYMVTTKKGSKIAVVDAQDLEHVVNQSSLRFNSTSCRGSNVSYTFIIYLD